MLSFAIAFETKDRLSETDSSVKRILSIVDKTTSIGERLIQAFGTADKAEIAEKLGFSSVQGLYKVIRGERELDFEKLLNFRKWTKRTVDWLLTGETGSNGQSGQSKQKIAEIAKEQARVIFGSSQIATSEVEVKKACEILEAYLLSRGMQEYNLLHDNEFLMSKADLKLAQKFSFVRDKAPTIEEKFRQIVIDELKRHNVGEPDDSVTMEPADLILAPVVATIESRKEVSEELPLRKTG